MFGVGSYDLSELAAFGQFLARAGARRREQPVTHRRAGNINYSERLRAQVRHTIDDVRRGDLAARRDRSRFRQREAASEDRKATEDDALGLREQLVTPVERRPQRLVPRLRSAAPAGEQVETIVEVGRYLFYPERSGAGGRELDSQRNAVQAPADRRDGRCNAPVRREMRLRRGHSRYEQ